MIYVVGTDRCGTEQYAKVNDLLWQPYPPLTWRVIAKIKGSKRNGVVKRVKERLAVIIKRRKKGIADFRQSFCIDEIAQVDKEAEFVWLIRNPRDCIGSFLRRAKDDIKNVVQNRPLPEGLRKTDTARKKVGWWWLWTNQYIEKTIKPYKYKVIETEDICKYEKPYVYKVRVNKEENAYWKRLNDNFLYNE